MEVGAPTAAAQVEKRTLLHKNQNILSRPVAVVAKAKGEVKRCKTLLRLYEVRVEIRLFFI